MQDPPDGPNPAARSSPDLIGRTIGRYKVIAKIGHGGQGEVYLAEDPRLFRKVALKKLPPELANDRDAREKAVSEAIRASRMSDPHLAEVFDIIEENDDVTLVMEYVEGQMLRHRIAAGISLEEFWDVAVQCVEALDAAHRGGLLHRDIKPENIMITPQDQVKILDFGLAKRLPRPDELASMTTQSYTPDVVSGTPPYMSPEAHLNEGLDERSDLFSLGVVFYEMLAGHRPFRGNLAEVIDGILRRRPPPPSSIQPAIPESLDHVVGKLLAKDRRARYDSAGDLLNDLVAARRGELVVQTPTEPLLRAQRATEPVAPRPRRWPWTLGAALGAFVVLSLLIPDLRFYWQRTLGLSVLPDRVSAAVLPFEVVGGDADIDAFSAGLCRLVSERLNRLGAASGIYVAASGEMNRHEVGSPEKARAELGINVALRTRIRLLGTELAGELELVDAEGGRILDRKVIREAWANPVRFADVLTVWSARMLGMGDDVPDSFPLAKHEIVGGTFRFYLEGLGKLVRGTDSASVAEAIGHFQRALSIDPDFGRAWADLAWARFTMFGATSDSSWIREIKAAARKALDLDGTLPAAHHVQGRLLGREEAWENAVVEYQAAIDLDPAYRQAYRDLAETQEELGLLAEAEKTYESAIQALPHDYHPYWYLGYFHFHQGNDDKALEVFQRMTEAAPDLSMGFAYYGGLLVQVGNYQPAVEVLERAIDLNPIDSAFSNLGTAYFQLRSFDDAIRTYREAIGIGYDNHRMWYNLAEAYFWAPGKRHLAAEPYLRALELAREELNESPDNVYVLCELADLLPKVDQPEEAKTRMGQALEKEPENPYVLYWAALVEWQLGNKDEALSKLEKAIANGYSRVWIEDSAVFDEWRPQERFQAILESAEG